MCGLDVERTGTRGPRPTYHPACRMQLKRQRDPNRGRPKHTGRRDQAKAKRIVERLEQGGGIAEVARAVGASPNTVSALARQTTFAAPKLSDEARRALDDFGYFRQRYFGRVPTPWQTEAGNVLKDLLATPRKEYVVLNAPPGSGKSTLFVHDFLVWLAARDRSIRVLVGSRTYRQATSYTNRLRRTFARQSLAPVDSDDVLLGLAVEPTGVLSHDFGRFNPEGRSEQWAAGEFVLVQLDGTTVSEKEASFAAYGMDSGFLGGRYDVVVWDDLIDRKTLKTVEGMEHLVRLYEDEMETRLEPGGLLVLQGQRMASSDLYRHALDMKAGMVDDLDDEDTRPRKYRHIVYKAHDEARCKGQAGHGLEAPAWPEGCLLDPKRLPWYELTAIQENRAEKFRVLYQQEDVDPAAVLVPRLWIDGGRDPETGEVFPGCWDRNRGAAEIPKGLAPPLHSIATADPSASHYWSIQWWVYHPESDQRFLLDQIRQRMDAPEFLDFDYANRVHTGVMEEWQLRSAELGLPIVRWIVEANAAQRFLLQYDHVRTWQAKHKVAITSHQTQRNKTDAEFGVETIAPHYRFGRVRLPAGTGEAVRRVAGPLVDEVTRYPDSMTTDCIMAHWFMEWWLPKLFPKHVAPPAPARRPSWMRERAGLR